MPSPTKFGDPKSIIDDRIDLKYNSSKLNNWIKDNKHDNKGKKDDVFDETKAHVITITN